MDEKLLKQQIGKWNEACRFLKSQQINLSTGEWSAVEQLADFWRNRQFNADFVSECEEMIKILTDSDKFHSNHREIIEWSKTFRGIARQMYTKDEETYKQFQEAMRAFTREHISRNRQLTESRSVEQHNTSTNNDNTALLKLLKQNVERFYNAINYLKCHSDLLDENEKSAIEFMDAFWGVDDWTEENKKFLELSINYLNEGDKLHSNYKELIVHSKECRGIAKQYGLKNKELYVEFSKHYIELLKSAESNASHSSNRETLDSSNASSQQPTIRIINAEFADGDVNGEILRNYGTRLYTDTHFLTPRITYEVIKPSTKAKTIWYKVFTPSGVLLTASNRNGIYTGGGLIPGQTGTTAPLLGFGSDSATVYSMPGVWRVEFYENDICLYKTSFRVESSSTSTAEDLLTSMLNNSQHYGWMTESRSKKRKSILLWTGIFAFICVLIFLIYQFWYKDYAKDNATQHSYVFATNLFLRSSKEANTDDNQLGTIPYGTELVVYSDDGEWAYVKVNGEKGYVASDYLLNAEDFALLNGVWGNEDAKEVVETSRCRLAILNYLKSNNLKTGETGWQLFAKQKEMKPNSVLFPSLNDGYGNYAKFAFILKNNVTGQRKLILYAFEEDETPIFRYEEDAPESGNIKSVAYTKWNDQYRVTYSKKNITYTPPIQQQTEQEPKPFIIRSVEFANTDYDGNILTGFGKQLYTDVQYLKPRISYKKQNSASERLTFKVKILRPDGTLERSSSSPAGYTFEHTVNVWGGNGMCELTGWGNREGSAYQAGRYHYEIWHEEEMLYSTTIDIKKKEVVAPLSISSVAFANVNYNEYVLRNYGSQLYSDTQYLRAKVFYQKPTASTESFKLKVKIFNPDGSLSRGGGSPTGYTFETQLLLSGKEGSFFLTGWGNKEGTLYTAGNYRYEIWLDGTKLLYATMVNIKDKP